MSIHTLTKVKDSRLQGFLNNNKFLDITFIVESGSRLWGLKNEESDTDYTGVYIPSLDDCIMGRIQHVISHNTNPSKNTSQDVDIKLLSIHHFAKNLIKGDSDTVAVLHAPLDCFEYRDIRWEKFAGMTRRVISRSMMDSAHGGAKSRYMQWEKTGNPKMLYHACRFLYIAVTIMKKQRLELPLREPWLSILKSIKEGDIAKGQEVYKHLKQVLRRYDEFNLPKANITLAENLVLSFYRGWE